MVNQKPNSDIEKLRAELSDRIKEQKTRVHHAIEKAIPVLQGLPGLIEETRRYCRLETEKIYHENPEVRPAYRKSKRKYRC
jgi:hypothetical protein